ncbi:glomulin-like isoform X1 [Sitophilus oryzae]|uniref:Glomulin-like isoform X1 n=1 Tax=Sitophilus oryzae TaxID=7048 RepID=A0A6J2XFJ0_SITOR|nr:glomulin-like isoform X1 [Sitophilus oryzae]
MTEQYIGEFLQKLKLALSEGNIKDVLTLFKDQEYDEIVKNNPAIIIPELGEYLTNRNKENNILLFNCCVDMLCIISNTSITEETIIGLTLQIKISDESKFTVLLSLLCKVLCNLPPGSHNHYSSVFDAIHHYLEQMEQPDYETFENEERHLVDNSEPATNIIYAYNNVIIFYTQIINYITNEEINFMDKIFLAKHLMKLLANPLGYFPVEMIDNIRPISRPLVEEIVQKVLTFNCDPFIFSEIVLNNYYEADDTLIQLEKLWVAHLVYLVFCEEICINVIPKVYSPLYTLDSFLPLALELINQDNNTILIEKGLKLSHYIFTCLKNQKLSYLLLDNEVHSKFCEVISQVIVYNSSETIRKSALSIFESYLKLFEIKGVYLIITHLVPILTHGGLIGFIITFYKNLLNEEFNRTECNINEYFRGQKLLYILKKFCCLSEKEETNLVNNSDHIISCLNLLRYLALRDKKNVTNIWDFFSILEEIYLKPLRKGLELSRAHYDLEINNVKQEKLNKESIQTSVNVLGVDVNIDKDEKLRILNSSLTVFDVIESLLSRLAELIEKNL